MSGPHLVIELRITADAGLGRVLQSLAAALLQPGSIHVPAPPPASGPPARPRNRAGTLAKGAAQKSPPLSASNQGVRTGSRVWTEDRKAVLRRDWPTGRAVTDICRDLNALPGPTIAGNGNVAAAAGWLKLHRPPLDAAHRAAPPEGDKPAAHGDKPAAQRDRPPAQGDRPIRKIAAVPPRKPPGLLDTRDGSPSIAARQLAQDVAREGVSEVSWHDAMTWAERNGVQLGASEEYDLRATNAARRKLKLPRFVIVAPRGRPERLPDPKLIAAEAA